MELEEKELLETFRLYLENGLERGLEIYILEQLRPELKSYIEHNVIPYLRHSPINLREKILLEYIQTINNTINNLVNKASAEVCEKMHVYLENHNVMEQKQCKCNYMYHDAAIREEYI